MNMVDIVLINPRFETSYWGMEHALHLCATFGKRANMPVSALPLLAALTPAEREAESARDQNRQRAAACLPSAALREAGAILLLDRARRRRTANRDRYLN